MYFYICTVLSLFMQACVHWFANLYFFVMKRFSLFLLSSCVTLLSFKLVALSNICIVTSHNVLLKLYYDREKKYCPNIYFFC